MGNQASTLMSLLTLKEVIFAQNQLSYVYLRHHRLSLKFCFISLSFTPYARNFLIFQTPVLFRLINKVLKVTEIQTYYEETIGIKWKLTQRLSKRFGDLKK